MSHHKLSNISLEVASDLIEEMASKEIKDMGNFRVVEGVGAGGRFIQIVTVGSEEALLVE